MTSKLQGLYESINQLQSIHPSIKKERAKRKQERKNEGDIISIHGAVITHSSFFLLPAAAQAEV